MKTKAVILFQIIIIITFISCSMGLTNEEKTLINSGGANEPFRTLLTTNTEDSLILRQKSQPIAFKKDAADLKLLIARLKATLEYDHLRGILFIDKLCE